MTQNRKDVQEAVDNLELYKLDNGHFAFVDLDAMGKKEAGEIGRDISTIITAATQQPEEVTARELGEKIYAHLGLDWGNVGSLSDIMWIVAGMYPHGLRIVKEKT